MFLHNLGAGVYFFLFVLHSLSIGLVATAVCLFIFAAIILYLGVFIRALRKFSVTYAKFRKLDAQAALGKDAIRSWALTGLITLLGFTLASGIFL